MQQSSMRDLFRGDDFILNPWFHSHSFFHVCIFSGTKDVPMCSSWDFLQRQRPEDRIECVTTSPEFVSGRWPGWFGSVFCSLSGFTMTVISCLLTWFHLSELLAKILFSCLSWIFLMVPGLAFLLPRNGFSLFSASLPAWVFGEAARWGVISMIF